jgi:hypothetical protein
MAMPSVRENMARYEIRERGAIQMKASFPRIMLSLPGVPPQSKGASMKNTLIRFFLIAAALLALSATTALADGGGFPPLCPPGKVCQ